MVNVLRIFQGSECIADGVTAWVIDGALNACERAMDVFARVNAAQMAVQDRTTQGNKVAFTIRRTHGSGVAARDHGTRVGQKRTAQATLELRWDDGTDEHVWTLDSQDANGAAWKMVTVQAVNGFGTEVQYTVEGGLWTYTGPLAETYDDTIEAVRNSPLCNVVNSYLQRVNIIAGHSLVMPGDVFTGEIVYPQTTLAGTVNFNGNTGITAFRASSLASFTGHVDLGGCPALTTVQLPGTVALTNGFYFSCNGCALPTATVNAILLAFKNGRGSTTSGTLLLNGGTNGSPTGGTGNANYTALTGAGITVSIN